MSGLRNLDGATFVLPPDIYRSWTRDGVVAQFAAHGACVTRFFAPCLRDVAERENGGLLFAEMRRAAEERGRGQADEAGRFWF